MNYDTWKIHDFSTGITSGDDYKKFQRNMRSDLRKQAADNHMVIQEFSGSSCMFLHTDTYSRAHRRITPSVSLLCKS